MCKGAEKGGSREKGDEETKSMPYAPVTERREIMYVSENICSWKG